MHLSDNTALSSKDVVRCFDCIQFESLSVCVRVRFNGMSQPGRGETSGPGCVQICHLKRNDFGIQFKKRRNVSAL